MTRLKSYLALVTLVAAAPAIAGEITGTGEETPIKSRGVASSVCAFSGLNDDGLGPSVHVQSPGMFVAAFGSAFAGIPGGACRGYL